MAKYSEIIGVAIERVVADGYEKLLEGTGDYRGFEKEYRSMGYVTYGCFITLQRDVDKRQYVLYGRPRKSKAPTTTPATPQFETMTVKELREYCKKASIKGYSKMSKAEILAALKSA